MRRSAFLVPLALVAAACGGDDSAGPSTTGGGVAPEVTAPEPTAPASSLPEVTAPEPTGPGPAPTAVLPPDLLPAADLFEPLGPTVIPHGPDGAWNARFTDPGAVVVHDGAVYVFQNGFPTWPGPVGVGLWRSDDDGATFAEVSADPVFEGNDLPYAGVAVLASSVHVEPDGTWVMYFSTWEAITWPTAPSRIGRATAPAPEGPWTADAEPVLEPEDVGAWASGAVRAPSVVLGPDGEYHMWFSGVADGTAAIGHATSTDGVEWAPDPEPVLLPSTEGWDSPHVHQPRVVLSPDGFVMAYTAANSVSNGTGMRQAHGLAVSADGVTWTRSDGPVVDAAEAGGRIIWFIALAWTGDRYLYFAEVGTGGTTDVHVAVHQGSVLPPG